MANPIWAVANRFLKQRCGMAQYRQQWNIAARSFAAKLDLQQALHTFSSHRRFAMAMATRIWRLANYKLKQRFGYICNEYPVAAEVIAAGSFAAKVDLQQAAVIHFQ